MRRTSTLVTVDLLVIQLVRRCTMLSVGPTLFLWFYELLRPFVPAMKYFDFTVTHFSGPLSY